MVGSVRSCILLAFIALQGCASLSGSRDQYFVCPYDTVWNTTVETMKGYSINSHNKDNGTIETSWVEMEGTERTFGVFGREGFGNRERARMTVKVKQLNDVSSVSVLETRQRWHARGGATSQATKWWPMDPSQESMDELTQKLDARLKEKGCERT
ncbi:MAG TPA: hypothetical protein VLC51_02530 [Nitrospira sp.]|nr:hypothetical protein [Nitrospira sp.]